MVKKLHFALLIIFVMVLVASCAPKPTAPAAEEPVEAPEIPATGEAPIDKVAEDISDSVDTDDELDTSELDDVDTILADIENI